MSEFDKKDSKYVWHPFTQMKTAQPPLQIVRAEGATLIAQNGLHYLDVNSSWWVNVHGHGKKEIGEAIRKQFEELDHVIFADVTHPSAIELAEQIVTLLGDPMSKVFFSDDGSTAVEVALKMAIQYWHNAGTPKKRILALDGAYHGDTFGAMAVGQRGFFNIPFEPFFFNVDFLEFPDGKKDAGILEKAHELLKTGEFAALIIEPIVQGSAGMRIYSAEFLEKLVALARENDALIIFDEVMTGWGRTGKLFAFQHSTAVADLICLSKGLTGGVLPLGLTVATEQIFTQFLSDEKSRAFLHGHSFTGNALACAAANASISLFYESGTFRNIERLEMRHKAFVELLKVYPSVSDPRCIGTILAFEIITSNETGYFATVRDRVYQFMLEKGVLLRPLGNTVYLNPPYCITDEELDVVYGAILEFIDSDKIRNI